MTVSRHKTRAQISVQSLFQSVFRVDVTVRFTMK